MLSETFAIARPAAAVWAELVADDPLSWCRILDRIEWTSERPFGVGTTRTASALKGTNVLDERFFIWEEGRRKAFYAERASAPLFSSLAEDYVVEPDGEGACRFTWTIAADPKPWARPAGLVNRKLLGTLFTDTRRHFSAG